MPGGSLMQVALFRHGSARHSSISVVQFLPVNPGKQMHV